MSHQNIKNIVARVDKSKKYLYNFIVINNEKIRIDIYIYLKARGDSRWHNQKEDGQKLEHIQKDQHGKKSNQHLQVAHIATNQ